MESEESKRATETTVSTVSEGVTISVMWSYFRRMTHRDSVASTCLRKETIAMLLTNTVLQTTKGELSSTHAREITTTRQRDVACIFTTSQMT